MQPSQGSKPPAHFLVSVLLSNTTKALCKALESISQVQRRLPRGRLKGTVRIVSQLLHQEMELTSSWAGVPLPAALTALTGSSHRAEKPRDLSPHCPVQQRLERCSSRTPSSWHFSHSLLQTPPDSLLYHFQQLRTLCPTHASSSPIRHGFIHRPTTMDNRKEHLQQAFLHRRYKGYTIFIPCRGSGGERGSLDSSRSHLQVKTKKFSSQCCKTKHRGV